MNQEVLDRLKKLQEILAEKYTLEKELKEIPKSLSTKTEVVSRLKKSFLEKNQQYDASKAKIVELKLQISEAETDREKSEALIVDITTQREYEALLKQIKDAGDREQQFRRDLQREEKAFEEMGQMLERDEATIQQQEADLRDEQQKINVETEQRQAVLGKLGVEEKHLTGDGLLSKEILFKFERIIMKKEGRGIVPLRKGVCTGCNMILPLQFVNEVRGNIDDQPHFCPYCSMILYHEDSDEGYFDFIYDEALSRHTDDDDSGEDEDVDEGRLMEAEMNEGYLDDEAEDDLDEGEEDEAAEDDDAEEVDSDEIDDESIDEDEIDSDDDDDIDEDEDDIHEDDAE
jgi:predicted  nucleic acid-binding Zn-ribbon protein